MVKSMTGFGSHKNSYDCCNITVEVKSVNNKFLDTSVRIPRSFLFAEEAVKSAVQRHISRGKVDVFVSIDMQAGDNYDVVVNENLASAYMQAINKVAEQYSVERGYTAFDICRMPDVLSVTKAEIDNDFFQNAIVETAEMALTDFDQMRLTEGSKLCLDVKNRLALIENLVSTVETKAPETVAVYRKKLEQKLFEVLENKNIDESRIITEAAIFADHIAVDEETVRLRSHIAQLKQMIEGQSPIGRKIDFLVQEFNREANTIGSKCQNSEIAHTVVDLKSEIEKIREQIQNIE